MKNIFKLLLFYLLVFVIFSLFYYTFLRSQIFSSQKVLFYRGIILLLIAFVPTLLSSIVLSRILRTRYESVFSSLILVLSLHICFFVLFPVTFDRSVTIYLLNSIKNNQKNYSCHGLTKKDLQDKLINEYVIKNDAINKRLIEQTIIDNIFFNSNCINLTNRGLKFLNFSRLIMSLYR